MLASAVTYALYYFGTGDMVRRLGSMRLAGLAVAASALMVLLHQGIAGEGVRLVELPGEIWFYALLMALISTVLPIYWMALAIQHAWGRPIPAAFGNLGPVITVFVAWLLLGQAISAFQAAGLALVLLGVSRLRSKAPTSVQSGGVGAAG